MKLDEKVLLGAACFFAGAVAGFLIAPIKKGIYCGNNNGNNYGDSSEENENDEDVSVKSEEEAIDEINKVINEVAKEINVHGFSELDGFMNNYRKNYHT